MWWRGGGGKKHWQSDKPKLSSHHTEEDDYMYSGGRGSAPSALHSRRPPALAHDVGHPEQLSSHREGPPRFGGDWLHDKRKAPPLRVHRSRLSVLGLAQHTRRSQYNDRRRAAEMICQECHRSNDSLHKLCSQWPRQGIGSRGSPLVLDMTPMPCRHLLPP